jgi:hypothetical protein
MHRPAVATHAVPPVERAAEKHILRANKDRFAFGIEVPFSVIFSAHENRWRVGTQPSQTVIVDAIMAAEACPQTLEPEPDILTRLLHKCPHRQAVNQPSGPCSSVGVLGTKKPVPEPGENDSSGFAQTCRDVDQLGATGSASTQRIDIFQAGVRPAGEPALIRIGLQEPCCPAEDLVKSRITHCVGRNLLQVSHFHVSS